MYNIILLLIVLLPAAFFDVKSHRVPNLLIVAACAAGVYIRGPAFVINALITTAVLFPLFFLRMTGSGDIKLIAVIFGYMGFLDGLYIVGLGFLTAAVRIIFIMKFQSNLISRFTYLSSYIGRMIQTKEIIKYYDPKRDGYENTIPLALYLFLGALIFLIIK